jgi:hypothetical protein
VPFGPRIFASVASTVEPSTEAPSIFVIRSAAFRPALSAGAPAIGSMTMRAQSDPSGVQPCVPSFFSDWIVAPMPSNWPDSPCSVFVKSVGLR